MLTSLSRDVLAKRANSSARQEVTRILWNPKVNSRVYTSLSRARSIQYTPYRPLYLTFILILSCILHLVLPRRRFPSGFFSPTRATYHIHLIVDSMKSTSHAAPHHAPCSRTPSAYVLLRPCVIRNALTFYSEEFLAPVPKRRTTPSWLCTTAYAVYSQYPSYLQAHSSIRNPRTHYVLLTETHLKANSHTHIHTHTHTYTQTHIHRHAHTYTHTDTQTHTHIDTHT